MSEAKYNGEYDEAFNHDARPDWQEITPQDNVRSWEALDLLVEVTRQQLNEE